MRFHDAPYFVQPMLFEQHHRAVLPTFREWVLNIDMGVACTDSDWLTGVDVLPLLKHTTQAQRAQRKPKFSVKLRNSNQPSERRFLQHLDAVFRPKTAVVPRREHLFASTYALLIRKMNPNKYEHLDVVLKGGVGTINEQFKRRALVRSFGFKRVIDGDVCMGYLWAGG